MSKVNKLEAAGYHIDETTKIDRHMAVFYMAEKICDGFLSLGDGEKWLKLDKVFGLLGIDDDEQGEFAGVWDLIGFDFEMTLEENFFINENGFFKLLMIADNKTARKMKKYIATGKCKKFIHKMAAESNATKPPGYDTQSVENTL